MLVELSWLTMLVEHKARTKQSMTCGRTETMSACECESRSFNILIEAK